MEKVCGMICPVCGSAGSQKIIGKFIVTDRWRCRDCGKYWINEQ